MSTMSAIFQTSVTAYVSDFCLFCAKDAIHMILMNRFISDSRISSTVYRYHLSV
jgi:hypothetical protein